MAAENTGPGSLAEHGRGLCPAVGVDKLMMISAFDDDSFLVRWTRNDLLKSFAVKITAPINAGGWIAKT